MPNVHANGIDIEYEEFGDPSNPTLLLVMGLGAQMIVWDEGFCQLLADRGFHVIRYDNRDVGLSTKFDDAPAPDLAAAMGGDGSSAAYLLADMADDGIGLLDALGIEKAHIVGASMGGMIVQEMAIRHPEKVLSLCSIMSTTGDRAVGQPTPEAMAALMAPPPQTRDEALDLAVKAQKVIGGTFPVDEAKVRERAGRSYDRMVNPMGMARQLVAIMASPDRTPKLQQLDVPTLVIHGVVDPLVTPSGGEATAKAIPGAELLMLEGMGHDTPEQLWPQIVDAIVANTEKRGALA
ncbi:MAG: alpha/beta hydrolase [Actinobacteria bacterium]|nr:alpha/beta hydrolase [Actinomycetota bacterium]MBV9252900.1 alpha/beta hydrolase [Actinomycetota bacterium]MBV9663215.1 alpha/beta hydrolase [Actinomycetota bacterium]MBV9934464.1 alpha/beta hydrolase [Actinomycetota bacterium]